MEYSVVATSFSVSVAPFKTWTWSFTKDTSIGLYIFFFSPLQQTLWYHSLMKKTIVLWQLTLWITNKLLLNYNVTFWCFNKKNLSENKDIQMLDNLIVYKNLKFMLLFYLYCSCYEFCPQNGWFGKIWHVINNRSS